MGRKSQAPALAGNLYTGREMANHGDTCLLTVRPLAEAPPTNLLISSITSNGQTKTTNLNIPSGSVLFSINRLPGTSLGIVTPDYKATISSSPSRSIDKIQISQGTRKLAYLVLEGLNPANNYIEIVNLATQQTQQIKAQNGFALLSFTLEPGGKRLVFTEVGLRGTSSRQASWHIMLADLEKGWAKGILSPETAQVPEETALIPFAWSDKTGEAYLYGMRPFSGGLGKGVWTMQLEGSGLRQLLSESKFTRLPVLSPDGLQFAYLTSDIESLPNKYIPGIGAPPGNTLLTMNLKTGEEQVIANIKEKTFGAMAWSRNSNELLLSRQEWKDNNLTDTSITGIPVKGSVAREIIALTQPSSITDVFDYSKDGALLWVNKGQKGLDLMLKKRDTAPTSILSVPDGQIKIIGYLE